MSGTTTTTTTLVVGATGATGKYVVQMLLSQGQQVKVLVRSEQRMLAILDELFVTPYNKDLLTITEISSFADLSDQQLEEQVQGCDAVVSCLGHNLNFKGIFKDGHFVTQATQRLTKAILDQKDSSAKFILMGSDGVANPNGKDTQRPFSERSVLFVIRHLLPPHADNEGAADFVHNLKDQLEWTVVRPTDLIEGEPTNNYEIFDKPQGGLFGSGVATKSNVAKFMADLITQDSLWQEWKFQMPFIQDKPSTDNTQATTTATTTTTEK